MKTFPSDSTGAQQPAATSARDRAPIGVLVLALVVIFILRYLTVMSHSDMGQDIANYIVTMNTLFGRDPVGMGLLRPPLIAVILKPFALIFGAVTGVKLLGVMISVALGIPFYVLARRISPPWIAAGAAILFVLTPNYADMLTWGYITMFGIFFTILALHFFVSILEKPSVANVAMAGICASFIAGFHQLTLLFFLPLFVLIIIALMVFNRRDLQRNAKPFAAGVMLAVILSMPCLPAYLHLIGLQTTEASEPVSVSVAPVLKTAFRFGYLPWLWGILLALAAAIVALSWLWRQDKNRAVLLAVMLFFPLCLSLFLLPAPFVELNRRAHYFIYIPVWLLAGVAVSQLWSWHVGWLSPRVTFLPRFASVALVATLVVSGAVASQRQVAKGLDFYGYLNDTRSGVVDQVSAQAELGATIVAYPDPLGSWIESLAVRNTYRLNDREMSPYEFERDRSLIADRLLSGNEGIENGRIRLAYCYPYTEGPGDPILGAYVGGMYQDLLMFDRAQTYLTFGDSIRQSLESTPESLSADGNSEAMLMTAKYATGDAVVIQSAQLRRDAPDTVLTYSVESQNHSVTRVDIPIFLCVEDTAVTLDPGQTTVDIRQQLETSFQGVVEIHTQLSFEVNGATLDAVDTGYDRLIASFVVQGDTSTITFSFTIAVPDQPDGTEVVHYNVLQIIEERGIDYLAVDFRPGSLLWGNLPSSTKVWLDTCPYYQVLYTANDVTLYRVRPPV